MQRDQEKIMGALSLKIGDYKIPKEENDKNTPMNLASSFRKTARQRKNNGRIIANNNRL